MRWRVLPVLPALVAGLLVLADGSPAAAAVCSTRQVTHSGADVENRGPSLSDDGTLVAWSSDGEFGDLGDNADENTEIWLLDLDGGATSTDAVQVTDSTTGNAQELMLSGSGNRIAFRHTGDVTAGNPDGNPEVWRYEVATGVVTQVTDTTGGDNNAPSINDAGNLITFASNRNLGGQNADLNKEVWVTNVSGGFTNNATVSTGSDSEDPTIGGQEPKMLFWSDGDLDAAADNSDHNVEIFQANPTVQLTDTTSGRSVTPRLTDNATQMVFESTAPLVGANPDGNSELYLQNFLTGTLRRVTSSAGDEEAGNRLGGINDTGERIVFQSGTDLTGVDPELDAEVYLNDRFDHRGNFAITQGGAGDPAIDGHGTTVAYSSAADPTGQNPDHNREIFLATCGDPLRLFQDVAPTTAFYDQVQWMATAGVANGFPGGVFKPLDAVKRQQMANFLYALAGEPAFTPPATPTFTDVPATNPFFTEIEWMVGEGIANGFPGGLFKPQDAVKRQQMANFLLNLVNGPGVDLE